MTLIKEFHIDKDISIAKTPPGYFYTDKSVYENVIKSVFEESWQIIGHLGQFKNILNPFYFLKGSIDEPLLFINSDSKLITSNVCTHRANILIEHATDKGIRCEYHGRKFNLDGSFKSAPGFECNKDFPKSTDSLKKIKSEIWNSLIFCTLDNDKKITSTLDMISEIIPFYPLDKLNYLDSNEYELDANWLLYCENYLEGFHVPFVHEGLNREIDLKSYSTKLFKNFVLQTAFTKDPSLSFKGSKVKDSLYFPYAYYFFIFPNTMLNFYPWGISINIIEPLSVKKTKIKYITLLLNGKARPMDIDSSVDRIELEDQKIVLKSQIGIGSRYYSRGRYSKIHETGLHHFHRFLLNKLKTH